MLELFPESVLDNSLHTSILVGLLVTWLMFEAFGWVFAGFVVSGYLAALAVVAPSSLIVVVVEALVTYGFVWLLATGLSQAGLWSHVFGRERFLLFVLVAVPVRLVVTGLAMPRLEGLLLTRGIAVDDFGLGLFGVGVVLVPLTANTFYKLGISRGLLQLTVNTTLTWIVVGPVLSSLTNFGFGNFEQTFDALAVSAWSSSRAVLVLFCTVFVAAQNNLRFGWDFGGILVPALLAMLVFEPLKMVSTVGEMFVLYALYEGFVRLPFVTGLDLEGPRRIVSIYVVSWAWKWALAAAVGALSLTIPVSDVFGFGYLLTSLVVARAHKGGGLLRTVVPLVWTSVQGVLIALPLAVVISWLPQEAGPSTAPDHEPRRDIEVVAPLLADAAATEGSLGEAALGWSSPPTLDPAAEVGVPVRSGARTCTLVPPDPAGIRADVPRRIVCGGDGPLLVVPRPHGDPDAGWLAGWLAPIVDASGVVVASVDPSRHPTRAADATSTTAITVEAARALAGSRPVIVVLGAAAGPSRLFLRDPSRVEALRTRLLIDDLVLDNGALPSAIAPWWDTLAPQDGVLVLARDVVRDPVDLPAPLPLSDAVRVVPDPAPRHPDLLVDVVLPAARRAAAASSDTTVPGWLRHLAGLVGGTWIDAVDDEGRAQWVLARHADHADAVDRFVVRPGGRPWTVVTTQAWRWPGLVDVALHHHRALEARLTWISAQPPHGELRWRDEGRGSALADRIVRALLAPADDWRDAGVLAPPGHVLLVEAAPDDAVDPRLSHGNEVVEPSAIAPLSDALRDPLGPWPGWRPIAEGTDEAAWQPLSGFAATYQTAIAADQLAVVWYPPALLREPKGTSEHAARLAWYRANDVVIRTPGDVEATLAAEAVGDPISVPGVEERLRAHVAVPSDATLASVRALPGWHVEVWDAGLRLMLVVRSQETICTRVATSTEGIAFPWLGCWRRR